MSEWKKVKLGEVCEISAGGDRPQIFSNHITDKCRIPIYSNGIDNEGLYGFTDTPKNNGNAITITGRGANAGTVFYRKDPFLSIIRLLTLTPNSEIINAKYLFYLLKNKTFLSTGSAQPQITVPNISQFEIEFNPDIETQHRIATILSRYDSLIENYQKQIKLLEEAAQRLYKEWFIDLRFPGHENTNIVDGVPEGWERKKVEEIGTVITGKTPSTSNKENYGGSIPFITIPDMHTGIYPVSSVFLSEKGAESQSKKYIPQGALIVSCIGTAGLVCITKERCQTNQQINSLILDDKEMLHYMYFVFLSLKEHLNNIGSNGATMTNVNKSKFEGIDIVVPSSCIIRDFSQRTTPYFENIKSLQSQLRLLTEARDRLLPKLMSGEIEVLNEK